MTPLQPRRVHVGCGPKNILAEWWNVDLRPFPGVDQVLDVTSEWPWKELDFVYGEHFLEHLPLDGALRFLKFACKALGADGRIRLSTPALEWVLKTHFSFAEDSEVAINETFAINRAFHGWGHKFLYSKSHLSSMLEAAGFEEPTFHEYGHSTTETLQGLERHGGYRVVGGYPSVWIVEASPGRDLNTDTRFLKDCEAKFLRYVASGH